MKLPADSAEKISEALVSRSLLQETSVAELVKSLDEEKVLNWNLILTKQYESEEGGADEADS